MELPVWTKPAVTGMVAGGLVVAVVGFAWGGWVTGSTSMEMANDASMDAVTVALTPYCVERSKMDPEAEAVMKKLRSVSSYQRRGVVEEAGWATPLGSEEVNRNLAVACQAEISKTM